MYDVKEGYTVQVVQSPSVEPVQTVEVESQLTGSPDTGLVEALIKSSRDRVESFLGRALVTQTLRLHLGGFPYDSLGGSVLTLPYPPLQSVDHVKYHDLDDTEKTVGTSVYTVVTEREPGAVQVKHGQHWPTDVRFRNAVRVQFKAGYGDARSDVPDSIRKAILMDTLSLYRQTQPEGDPRVSQRTVDNASVTYRDPTALMEASQGTSLPPAALALLQPYRVMTF